MRWADMNKRIEIQEPTRTADSAGASELTWTTLCRVWAAITTKAGSENITADSQRGVMQYEFKLRYNASVTEDCRIVWGSRVFQITSPPENVHEMGRQTTLLASEVT